MGRLEALQQLEFASCRKSAAALAGRVDLPLRRPCPCSRNTSYWSTCAPTEPPGAAKETMTSSIRQRGRKSNAGSSAATSASHLSTSCTSRVQSWCGSVGTSPRGTGRGAAASGQFLDASCSDDARQRGVLAGQSGQVFGRDRRDETRERIADQQRTLLPVVAQELRRRHAQRRQRRGIDLDRQRAPGHVRCPWRDAPPRRCSWTASSPSGAASHRPAGPARR